MTVGGDWRVTVVAASDGKPVTKKFDSEDRAREFFAAWTEGAVPFVDYAALYWNAYNSIGKPVRAMVSHRARARANEN